MMSNVHPRAALQSTAFALALACMSVSVAVGATAQEVIKSRQHELKSLGAATKTVRDQLKQTPDVAKIKAASVDIKKAADAIATWFPSGTGPEAGVKTAAKPEIWSNAPAFADATKNFVQEAGKFSAIADSGDVAAIGPAFKSLGQTCSGCHDKFRVKED